MDKIIRFCFTFVFFQGRSRYVVQTVLELTGDPIVPGGTAAENGLKMIKLRVFQTGKHPNDIVAKGTPVAGVASPSAFWGSVICFWNESPGHYDSAPALDLHCRNHQAGSSLLFSH